MTVGARLQHVRTERKLSLADVAKDTKIQPWVLEALESDRLQELMSPVYVKGFLSTYARFLRLEPESLIAQLLIPPPPNPEARTMTLPPAERSLPSLLRVDWMPRRGRRLQAAAAVGVVLVGMLLLHPVRRVSHLRSAQMKAPVAQRQAAHTAPTRVSAPRVAQASVTQVSGPPLIPTATPSLETVMVQPVQLLEVTVSARRTTWVEVRADGKLLTQQRLQRGANERWVAKKRLELVVAKPAQVELTLNGQPISSYAIAHQGRLLITHRGVTQLPQDE